MANILAELAAAMMLRIGLVNLAVSSVLGQQRLPPSSEEGPLGLVCVAFDVVLAVVSSDTDASGPAPRLEPRVNADVAARLPGVTRGVDDRPGFDRKNAHRLPLN